MDTEKEFGMFRLIAVYCLSILLSILSSKAQGINYWIIVDEHDTPLPAPPPEGWYYNWTGGDRGKLHEENVTYTWDGNSVYNAEITYKAPGELWTWGGMWYSLIRVDADNIPLDFNAIFGPYVKSEYQGEVSEIEIVVSGVNSPSNNQDLELTLQLKDADNTIIGLQTWTDLRTGPYPKTYTWSLPESCKQKIETVLWIIDKAQVGDSISIDKVRFRTRVPDLTTVPTQEQAFLWTYSWLMTNYDSNTGMIQDRSNFKAGSMENVSATAKAAKIAYYAWRKGYSTRQDAEAIITKIADILINKVPRGPSGINKLWPHFTDNGGTEAIAPHDGYAGTEWSSGDTAYAALDIITALQLIGDPNNQINAVESFLKEIDWTDLLSPEGYIYHGYLYEGDKILSCWQGFGMETIGVNWAYASATKHIAGMQSPPSDNGSGFIDNAQYPMVFSGQDRWGNNWDNYRNNMADVQTGWYCTPEHNDTYLCDAGLFGLSAAENPQGDTYIAYGVGGRNYEPNDGNGVIVPHYAGMISDIRPTKTIAMWETLRDSNAMFLQNRIVLSPLNNIESMKVDKATGALTINHLKGSWNLALQAEGWALLDSGVKGDLNSAVTNNPFLKDGYDLLRGTKIYVPENYPTIQQAIDAAVSGTTIMVAAGTYNETLRLNKSGIILQGDNRHSIIDGQEPSPIIYCENISGDETVIKGFTINDGDYGIQCAGTVTSLRIEDDDISYASPAGIYLENGASVVIANNYIHHTLRGIEGIGATVNIVNNEIDWNRGSYGGGIYLTNSTTLIQNNSFFENWDGAISLYSDSNATIIGNKIYRNGSWDKAAGLDISYSTAVLWNNIIEECYVFHSPVDGGGLDASYSDISAYNNIFRHNTSGRGAAMRVTDTNLKAQNNIFVENYAAQETVLYAGTGTQEFCYNDMWGNSTTQDTNGIIPCVGNITVDPLFVNTINYYLSPNSLCIDAGDPASQYNDFWDGSRNDIGLYGGPFAKNWLIKLVDLNNNHKVDFSDFAVLAGNWLNQGQNLGGDINNDGIVDIIDLKLFASCWLESDI